MSETCTCGVVGTPLMPSSIDYGRLFAAALVDPLCPIHGTPAWAPTPGDDPTQPG